MIQSRIDKIIESIPETEMFKAIVILFAPCMDLRYDAAWPSARQTSPDVALQSGIFNGSHAECSRALQRPANAVHSGEACGWEHAATHTYARRRPTTPPAADNLTAAAYDTALRMLSHV